jgi:hypothetical protein
MKKMITTVALASLVAGMAQAQIKKDWTIREVRDPRQLQAGLESAFTGVEAALVAIDPDAGQIRHFAIKGGTSQDARIDITVNNGAAAGNKHRLLVDAAGNALLHQTDTAEAGSYVTQLTLGKDGKVTMVGGAILDNTTSADELNITETTVKVTGAFTATGAATLNGGLVMDTDKVVIANDTGNTVIKGTFGAGGADGTGIAVDANGDLTVKRDSKPARDAIIGRNATVAGTLEVTGATTLTGALAANGAVNANGNLTVLTNKLVVTAANGNVASAGAITADGLIQTGKSGTAGDLRIYPTTASRGYLKVTTAPGAGDTVTTLTVAEQATTRTYTIPDAGAAASFVMTAGNQILGGTLGINADFAVLTNKFNVTAASGNTAIAGTLGCVGDFKVNTDKFVATGADGNVTIAGTLGVTGVATLTAAPKFTAVTAPTDVTATMTNAPALAAAAAPVWVTVTIGSDNYVIPAFKLGE